MIETKPTMYRVWMADLTPDETDALTHWSTFGQPGEVGAGGAGGAGRAVASGRYIPTAEDLAKVKPFVSPDSADWRYDLDSAQTAALLAGSRAREMEQKWNIWSDDPSATGATSVYFCRSWTGKLILRVDLELTDAGSRVVQATWEMDPAAIKTPSESFAREMFEECCAWVLGMARPTPSTTN